MQIIQIIHFINIIDFFQVSLFIPIARITLFSPTANLLLQPSIVHTSTMQSFAADHAQRPASYQREDLILIIREEKEDLFRECLYKIPN